MDSQVDDEAVSPPDGASEEFLLHKSPGRFVFNKSIKASFSLWRFLCVPAL